MSRKTRPERSRGGRLAVPDVVQSEAKDALFDRVAAILEQARGNVVRAVNTNMVLAYWLIGREIVEEIQRGEERAEYGERVIEDLSARFTERYGKGFSVVNLQWFRKFYLAYRERVTIPYPMGTESAPLQIPHPAGTELAPIGKGRTLGDDLPQGFSPQLSWSHYRALMRVESREARDFYEREAIAGGWDKRTLERQIQSFYYERILKSRKPEKMLAEGRNLPIPAAPASQPTGSCWKSRRCAATARRLLTVTFTGCCGSTVSRTLTANGSAARWTI